jgi:hypothetical protein
MRSVLSLSGSRRAAAVALTIAGPLAIGVGAAGANVTITSTNGDTQLTATTSYAVSATRVDASTIEFTSTRDPLTAQGACLQVSVTAVRCPISGTQRYGAGPGVGVFIDASATGWPMIAELASSVAARIKGSSAADVIVTGAGEDEIHAGAGDDRVDSGDGDDLVRAEDTPDGSDTLDLGAGTLDRVTYERRDGDVTLAGTPLSGGAPGEHDVIRDAEQIVGGAGDDHVDARDIGATVRWLWGLDGDDVLASGAGSQELNGGPGDDQLAGGTGTDVYQLGDPIDTRRTARLAGHDTVDAVDGERDYVYCHSAARRALTLDTLDVSDTCIAGLYPRLDGIAAIVTGGPPTVGRQLSATTDWVGALSYELEWQTLDPETGWVRIAQGPTYTPTQNLTGRELRLVVTGVGANGSARAATSILGTIAACDASCEMTVEPPDPGDDTTPDPPVKTPDPPIENRPEPPVQQTPDGPTPVVDSTTTLIPSVTGAPAPPQTQPKRCPRSTTTRRGPKIPGLRITLNRAGTLTVRARSGTKLRLGSKTLKLRKGRARAKVTRTVTLTATRTARQKARSGRRGKTVKSTTRVKLRVNC